MNFPQNLPLVVQNFGSGNYPAGSDPWSGQPTGVAPINPYVLPGVPIAGDVMGYLWGVPSVALQSLMNILAASWATNWPYWTPSEDSQINADYVRIGGVGYLATTGQSLWLAMGGAANLPTSGSNTMTALISADGGKTFQSLNFPSTGMTAHSGDGVLDGIAGDTTGGIVITATDFTTVPAIKIMAFYSSAWHTASPNYVGSFPTSLYWDAVSNVYVYGDVFQLYTLPAASTSPTQHFFTGAPSGAASVVTSLVIPKGDGSGVVVPATQTGTPWQHSVAFSAPTTTTPTYGTFAMANTDIVTGGDYGAGDALYMVARYNGSSATTFATSPDGLTWTDGGAISGHVMGLQCLAGKIWVALRTDGLIYYSTDVGANWTAATNKIAGNINQLKAFKANALHTQLAAFGSFSFKNVSTPTESRMMICSQLTG